TPKHKISKTTPCKVEWTPARGRSGRSRPGHERSVVTARMERRLERSTKVASPCDQRRTMQPDIGTQLVQDKPCDVFSRYGSTMEVGKIRERPDGIAARLVVQHGRANENPVEAAFPDDRFLPVLVGVHVAQEKRENHVVEQKAAMSGTVTRANPGDANQAGYLLGLHRTHERARCAREKCHFAERTGRCAECTDDGVAAFKRLTQGDLVAGVSDDELGPLKNTRLFGRPHQHGYVIPSRHRLADDQAAGAAGRSKDQYVRLSSPDSVSYEILHGCYLGKRDAP